METEQFKVGDVVRLKSGGPEMTVDSSSASLFRCVWFSGGYLREGHFPTAVLERATPSVGFRG